MRISAGSTVLVCVMAMAIGACAFTNPKVTDEVLVETAHGTVFLQNTEDGWFRTAHPFDLSPDVLTRVFRGVYVQRAPTDPIPEDQVFSEEDIAFLSPLMSIALAKATKRQVVGFRVMHDRDGRPVITGGILYIQGRLLHLTLTHIQARPDDLQLGGPAQWFYPHATKLEQPLITFTPEAARRSSRHEQTDVTAAPPLASLVLDYEALIEAASLPPASVRAHPLHPDTPSVIHQIVEPIFPTNGASASHERPTRHHESSRSVQVPSPEHDGELEALKDEVRRLQRRLSEFDRPRQDSETP